MAAKRRTGGPEERDGDWADGAPPEPRTPESSGSDSPQPPSSGSPTGIPPAPAAERELIVMVAAGAGVRAEGSTIRSSTNADVSDLASVVSQEGVTLEPLFGQEDVIRSRAASLASRSTGGVPDLSVYYRVRADDDRLGVGRPKSGRSLPRPGVTPR